MPMAKARIPEMKTAVKIIKISWRVIDSNISFIATAAPERDRFIEKIVINERAMTTVFIEPTKKRKPFLD